MPTGDPRVYITGMSTRMRIRITAGNTQAPIDEVRCITNVFSGRTGALIAEEARRRGHAVTLLTSAPAGGDERAYRTFDEFAGLLEAEVRGGDYDVVILSAAVSDYRVDGVFAPEQGTRFDPADGWLSPKGAPRLVDKSSGKVKSNDPELWLRLTQLPKLVDRVREPWSFRGVLVKFKLEVDVTEAELLQIAARSREQSSADLIVANRLEAVREAAHILSPTGSQTVSREALAAKLLDEVERMHAEKV